MELGLLLIFVGIALGILLHRELGIVVALLGVILLIVPLLHR